MASLSELEDALKNADAAGDADSARILADEIVKMRGPSASQQAIPQRNLSDVPAEAAQNFMPSLKNTAAGLYGMVAHPVDNFLKPLDDATTGGLRKLEPEWLKSVDQAITPDFMQPAPETVARQDEAANQMGEGLKHRYGGWDNIKNTMATDPVGSAFDLATIPSMAGSALRGAGMVRAGNALVKAGDVMNPANAVTKPTSLLAKPAAHTLGLTTGAGGDSVIEAFRAGERGGDYAQTFRDNMRGVVPQDEVLRDAHAGIGKMAADRSAEYKKGMQSTRAAGQQIDMTPIEQAFVDVKETLFEGGLQKTDNATLKKMNEIGKLLEQWKQNPNGQTAIGLDALKQRIDSMMPSFAENAGDSERVLTAMRNAVKNTIVEQVPEYANTMRKYEESITTQKDIQKALSLTSKSSKDTTLRKLQSVMRNNANTNYGSRVDNVKKLEATGAAPNIMPKLAGQSLGSLMPRGLSKLLAGGALGYGLTNPLFLPAALAMSPRIVGELSHALGRMKPGNFGRLALPAVQGGRVEQLNR